MIAYKVVFRRGDDTLMSCMIWNENLSRIYIPNVETTAKVGGLLCFVTEDAAKRFQARVHVTNFEVWEAEVKECIPLVQDRLSINCSFNDAKELWKGKPAHKISSGPGLIEHPSWPEGTIAYKHVTLKRKVA